MFVEVAYEDVGFVRLKTPTGVVLEHVAFETYEVAPQGEVALLELDSDAGCFERAATLVHDMLVIAEYAAVCNLAAWVKTVGYGLQQPVTPLSGDTGSGYGYFALCAQYAYAVARGGQRIATRY